MKRRCKKCGMIRAVKDLVHLENDNYICFSCWNEKVNNNETNENLK